MDVCCPRKVVDSPAGGGGHDPISLWQAMARLGDFSDAWDESDGTADSQRLFAGGEQAFDVDGGGDDSSDSESCSSGSLNFNDDADQVLLPDSTLSRCLSHLQTDSAPGSPSSSAASVLQEIVTKMRGRVSSAVCVPFLVFIGELALGPGRLIQYNTDVVAEVLEEAVVPAMVSILPPGGGKTCMHSILLQVTCTIPAEGASDVEGAEDDVNLGPAVPSCEPVLGGSLERQYSMQHLRLLADLDQVRSWCRLRVQCSMMEGTQAAVEVSLQQMAHARSKMLSRTLLRSSAEASSIVSYWRDTEKARCLELQLLSREAVAVKLKGDGTRLNHSVYNYSSFMALRPEDLLSYTARHPQDGMMSKVLLAGCRPGETSRRKSSMADVRDVVSTLRARLGAAIQRSTFIKNFARACILLSCSLAFVLASLLT